MAKPTPEDALRVVKKYSPNGEPVQPAILAQELGCTPEEILRAAAGLVGVEILDGIRAGGGTDRLVRSVPLALRT